jgi:hypothetical protein
MGVNFAEIYAPDPFASGGTADAYKRRLLAAQLLQKKASEDDKVYSNSHGGMKLATALLGGMMEGWEEKKAKQGQAAVGRDLAGALASAGVSPGLGGISAPTPSMPSSGSPAGAPSLAGGGSSRAMAMPSEFDPLFAETEQKYNLPSGTLKQIAKVESSLNPNAKNPNSSASGLFQFINSTARQYGLTNPFDPVASTDAAGRLAADNAKGLREVLGRDPSPGELYLAHQQGLGGASKILSNPNASVASLVGNEAARLNRGAGMTAGDFAKQWTSKFDGAPQQIASADPGFMPGPLSEADAGLAPPEVAAATPAPAEQPPAPTWQTAQATPEEFDAQLGMAQGDAASMAPVAPLPPQRPVDLEALQPQQQEAPPPPPPPPPTPRVPPQAMAQALMGGGQQIDPNSNNAGAQQFAASGMGRGGQGMPQAPQQPPPQMAAPQAPSAPSGMYGGGAQPNAQYAQAGPSSAPAPARTATPAQPAMDPRAAHALRVINSPWATAGQISAAQGILKQLAPDVQLIPTADGHIIAVDKHNLGKGATPIYKAPEKGVVVEGEIRSPTAGTTIGPKREFRPLVTQADRDRYGIPAADKRPYVVGPDNRPIVTPGDPSTNVNVGTGETEEQKERGKGLAKRINTIADDGDEAAKDLAVAQRLHQLGSNVNPGTKTALLDEIRARTGIALDPNADNVQAYKAMIAYMKPRMRVAGSGVSSDKDMAAFEASLPSLLGTPGGNEIATQTIGGMAQLRLERGLLAQRWQLGEIDAKTFNVELAKLPDPLATFKEWQKANGGTASQGSTPASPSGGGVIRYDSQGKRIQ